MEESYNLTAEIGKYIETLFRQWRLILGLLLVCAIAAILVSVYSPKTFQARALVATIKSATDVSFGSGIETLTEEQLLSFRYIDPDARLQSYVKMVHHPDVAQAVLDEIGEQMPDEDRSVQKLLKIVSGGIAERSDLIEIVVRYSDRVMAAEIANAWSRAFVDQVNAVYSGGETQDAYHAIRNQTIEAREAYDEAQASLEVFISENQTDELIRQIDDLQNLIDGISDNRSFVVRKIISGTAETQLTVFDEQVNNSQKRLKHLYEQSRKVEQLLKDAQDMQDQVLNGGEGAVESNALALTLLKTQAFAANEVLVYLQIQALPASLTAEEMQADLEALIETLEERKEALEAEIKDLSGQLLTASGEVTGAGEGEAQSPLVTIPQLKGLEGLAGSSFADTPMAQEVQTLQERVNELKAKLTREQDLKRELTRARDLAWETYNTLTTKEAELEVALQATGSEVALASPATVPVTDTISGSKNVILAVVIGALLGIVAAYFIEFWWSYKGKEPRAITLRSLFRREE